MAKSVTKKAQIKTVIQDAFADSTIAGAVEIQHQYLRAHISSCADKAHLRELVKLKIAGNIRGDKCKSY